MDHGRIPLNDAEPLPIMDSFHRLLLRGENTLILGLGRKSAVGREQTDNEKHRVCGALVCVYIGARVYKT